MSRRSRQHSTINTQKIQDRSTDTHAHQKIQTITTIQPNKHGATTEHRYTHIVWLAFVKGLKHIKPEQNSFTGTLYTIIFTGRTEEQPGGNGTEDDSLHTAYWWSLTGFSRSYTKAFWRSPGFSYHCYLCPRPGCRERRRRCPLFASLCGSARWQTCSSRRPPMPRTCWGPPCIGRLPPGRT